MLMLHLESLLYCSGLHIELCAGFEAQQVLQEFPPTCIGLVALHVNLPFGDIQQRGRVVLLAYKRNRAEKSVVVLPFHCREKLVVDGFTQWRERRISLGIAQPTQISTQEQPPPNRVNFEA